MYKYHQRFIQGMFAEVDVTVTEDVLIFQMVMDGHLNVY